LKKKPKIGKAPISTKTPRMDLQNAPTSILDLKPSWRFDIIDLESSWGWFNIESKNLLRDILEKLKNFERMTWGEIERKKQSHIMPLDKIEKKAIDRLRERNLDDLEALYSIRISGKERIWGKRERDAFYIIWWDPDHTVYRVPLKHT
jgi:hypothetical protein